MISKADTSLIYNKSGVTIFLLVYVDDIIAASSSSSAINALLADLHSEFTHKDLSELHYFLGKHVTKLEDRLQLSQEKYGSEILYKAGMSMCKVVKTHLPTLEELSVSSGEALIDEEDTRYRSILGDNNT
jgi:hypothetical protein